MLIDALKTLANPPTLSDKRQALADGNAQIAVLEAELGIQHSLPRLNLGRIATRMADLEQQLATKKAAPARAPAAAAPAPAARPFQSSGSAQIDLAIVKAGCRSLAQYRAAVRLNEL